jgi:hypothetical protein
MTVHDAGWASGGRIVGQAAARGRARLSYVGTGQTRDTRTAPQRGAGRKHARAKPPVPCSKPTRSESPDE